MNFFKGLKEGFTDLGRYVNNIVNTVLLLFVYFIGVGFSWILAKLSKKKVLEIVQDKTSKTYWKDYGLGKQKKNDYYRQF